MPLEEEFLESLSKMSNNKVPCNDSINTRKLLYTMSEMKSPFISSFRCVINKSNRAILKTGVLYFY